MYRAPTALLILRCNAPGSTRLLVSSRHDDIGCYLVSPAQDDGPSNLPLPRGPMTLSAFNLTLTALSSIRGCSLLYPITCHIRSNRCSSTPYTMTSSSSNQPHLQSRYITMSGCKALTAEKDRDATALENPRKLSSTWEAGCSHLRL